MPDNYCHFADQIQCPQNYTLILSNSKREVRHEGKIYTLHSCSTLQKHGWERIAQTVLAIAKFIFCFKWFDLATHQQFLGRTAVSNYVEKPLCADFYMEYFEGPIWLDQRYQFSKNLQNPDGSPFKTDPSNLYVRLSFKARLNDEDEVCLRTNGKGESSEDVVRLPHTLFQNAREGSHVQFIYHDRAMELICKQKDNPNDAPFEKKFELDLWDALEHPKHYSFPDDLPTHKVCGIPLEDPSLLEPLLRDIKAHGPLEKLEEDPINQGEMGCQFAELYKTPLDQIFLTETRSPNLKHVWIFVPHRPLENQCLAGQLLAVDKNERCFYDFKKNNHQLKSMLTERGIPIYNSETWNPKIGHRRYTYKAGVYAAIPIPLNCGKPILRHNEKNSLVELTYSRLV